MLNAETAVAESPAAPAESGHNEFRADIQGLRAIAVVGVMLFHSGVPGIAGGFVGVDVFYVISGFLITGLMLRDAERKSGPRQLLEFYARRVRRIMPAAAVVVLATLAGAVVVENGIEIVRAATDAKMTTLFASNVHFIGSSAYFAHNTASRLQQYWSLSVEEQFYAIWPLLFLVLGLVFVKRRRAATVAVVLALCIASFAVSVFWTTQVYWTSLRSVAAFYLLTARAWELGIGVLLALGATSIARVPARLRAPLAWIGLAMIAASMFLYDAKTTFPGWTALLPTLGTAAVIAAGIGYRRGDVTDRALSSGISQALGRYSYSLYLWHWPVLLLIARHLHIVSDSWIMQTFWMVALSGPAAVLTYHLVENPVRNAKPLRGRPLRSLGLGVAIMAVSLVAVAVVTNIGYRSARTNKVAASAPVGTTPEIVGSTFVPKNLTPNLIAAANKQYVPKGCGHHCSVVIAGAGQPTMAVFGDSHSEHLIPGLAAAARAMGVGLDQHTFDGCSWFDNIGDRLKNPTCDDWRAESLRLLEAKPPELIILSSRNDRGAATRDAWEASVRRTLALLPATSKKMVVSETPIAQTDLAQCLADNLTKALKCDQDPWPEDWNQPLLQLASDGGASFLDLKPVLCNERRCPAIIGNRLIWRDDDHLTLKYSTSLAPWMRAQIEPVLRG
jgi:peptidoglycan/LPS O-acetylase OafA/YrhL